MVQIPMMEAWRRYAAERPDSPALTVGDTGSLTWRELDDDSTRTARAFAALGVGEDDIVTMAMPNSASLVLGMLAALKLGATPQPVSFRMPHAELSQVIGVTRPALVIGAEPGAFGDIPCLPGFPSLAEHGSEPLPTVIARSFKAPTSGGSTGVPKVILSTTPAVTDDKADPPLRYPRDGAVIFPGPLYHNSSLQGTLVSLSLGNHVVLLERFDPRLMLALVERHRVSFTILAPTMMNRIWRLPAEEREAFDLSSLATVMHTAGVCPPHLKRAWIDWLGADRIYEGYASTELHAVTFCGGEEWLERPGTVGRVYWGQIKVMDSDHSELPPGQVGDIWMRPDPGSGPTYRYLGATAREHDGWESVGDLGWIDADGYVFLADRRADLIITGGANVYPAEVENALSQHPAVEESVVIGLPDDDMGELVHAVVHTGDHEVDEETLRGHISQLLAPYKCPRSYEFVQERLREESGKVRRASLRRARTGGA